MSRLLLLASVLVAFAARGGSLIYHFDFNTLQRSREAVVSTLAFVASNGYDAVLWEIEDKVRFDTCPEIAAPDAFTKEEFRGILADAKRLGLEPIPLLQTFGHAEYVLCHERYRALREQADGKSCYCPSKPETRVFLKTLLHEYLDLFGPDVRRFHLGGDEVWSFASCPVCKARKPFELYAEHLEAVAAELRARGIRPGCWHDMILKFDRDVGGDLFRQSFRDYTIWFWDYAYPKTWHWWGQSDGPLRKLRDAGCETIVCGSAQSWKEDPFTVRYGAHRENLSACADLVRRENLSGLCVTSWTIHQGLKRLQYPLYAFAARRLRNPGPDAASDWQACVEATFGPVPVDALDELTTWEVRYGLADGRGWTGYKDGSIPPHNGLKQRFKDGETGMRKLADELEGVADRTEAALSRIKGKKDLTTLGQTLAEAGALRLAFHRLEVERLRGGTGGEVPHDRAVAYYRKESPQASAERASRIIHAYYLPLPVSAAGWEINGSFAPGGADGLPRGWKYHTYSGYQPQAKIAVEQADAGNVLTISDVRGTSGAAIMWSGLFAAASGDVVKVSGEFKGTGTASVDLNHYSVTRAWNQPKGGIASHPVKLTADWRRHEFLMRIGDGKAKTGFVKPVLACAKGATAAFRNVTLEHRGTLRSGSWAFEPVRTLATEDFEDEKKSVRTGLPTVVSGIVSDGLLAKTRRGVFTTTRSVRLLSAKGIHLADEDRLGTLRVGLRLYALSANAKLVVRLSSGGGRLDFEMPAELAATSLPADIVFRAGKSGEWVWTARSLVDGGTTERSGVSEELTALPNGFDGALVLTAADGRTARTELDNLLLTEDRAVPKPSDLPAIVTPEATFDPRTKGWKKVFEDEFEGPKGALFDTAKWYVPHWRKDNGCARLDGEGHLAIRAEFEPGTTNLQTSGIWSVPSWRYGFFEARVRFTRNNGWWAAFWLYGSSDRIASEDGAEIDIFEDYHTRRKREPGQPAPIALDHNLHVSYQRDMKSYNRTSFTPGSIDEFHTIGCKWTPFEVSLYMDGKLMSNATSGANPSSVTFDGFATDAICAPLHAIVSGQIMRKWGNRDLSGCTFPESYLVDWVRVWEYPTVDLPSVAWKDPGNRIVCEDGEELVLEVEATGKAEIREAYLFDDGAYLMARTNPPWRFRFPFSKERYRDTRFAVPGRQGVSPDWDRMLHSFRVYVRDAEGRVGVTETPVRRLSSVAVAEAAGEKSVQSVPGQLRFGQNRTGYVREFHTGEVRTCEIEVAQEGDYVGRFDYQSGNDFPNRVLVVVDGELAATAEAPGAPGRDWKAVLQTSPVRLRLTRGRHRLAFIAVGYLNLGACTLDSPLLGWYNGR